MKRSFRASAVLFIAAGLVILVSCTKQESLEAGKATTRSLMKLLPENTTSVNALDAHRAAAAEPVRKLLENKDIKAGYDNIVKCAGVDPLKDVYLAVSGTINTGAGRMPDIAVIFNVKYDRVKALASIKGMIPGAKEEKVGDSTLLTGLGLIAVKGFEIKPALAFLDSSNVVAGTEGAVRSVLAVYARKAPSLAENKRMSALIRRIEGSPMFWAAALIPPEMLAKLTSANPGLKVVEGIEGAALAVDYRNRAAALEIIASGGTEQHNKDLASALTALKMLGASGLVDKTKPEQAGMAGILNSVEISAGSDHVRIHALVPEEMLDALRKQAESKIGSLNPNIKMKAEPAITKTGAR